MATRRGQVRGPEETVGRTHVPVPTEGAMIKIVRGNKGVGTDNDNKDRISDNRPY